MSILYLSHRVFAHEAALVDIPLYTIDASLACILPHGYVTVVLQAGLTLCILGYHYLNLPDHDQV